MQGRISPAYFHNAIFTCPQQLWFDAETLKRRKYALRERTQANKFFRHRCRHTGIRRRAATTPASATTSQHVNSGQCQKFAGFGSSTAVEPINDFGARSPSPFWIQSGNFRPSRSGDIITYDFSAPHGR
ncbi:hypothetical protein [Saccharopolyspora spinosa]|uniref:hypothetical protein n=1 Tax=Saccharopolyspora spinosa TaxID=60894 RepID=UPI0011D1CA0E|nr:hypothetical protein [Saccharopolyspora spinosa]